MTQNVTKGKNKGLGRIKSLMLAFTLAVSGTVVSSPANAFDLFDIGPMNPNSTSSVMTFDKISNPYTPTPDKEYKTFQSDLCEEELPAFNGPYSRFKKHHCVLGGKKAGDIGLLVEVEEQKIGADYNLRPAVGLVFKF